MRRFAAPGFHGEAFMDELAASPFWQHSPAKYESFLTAIWPMKRSRCQRAASCLAEKSSHMNWLLPHPSSTLC